MPFRPDQQDVPLTLLALDAYNRGETPQLEYSEGKPVSPLIGVVGWERSSDFLTGPKQTGFSASEYVMGSQKVIAYRGTDLINSGLSLATLKDVATRWLSSLGLLGPTLAGTKLQHTYAGAA